jgi:hypothetical protein
MEKITMKLLTKAQEKKLIDNYNLQEANNGELEDLKVVAKIFNPYGRGTWYLSELNPDDKTAFGVADLGDAEMGYIDLKELENLKTPPFNMPLERDQYFPENKHTLTECLEMCKNA